MQLLVPSSRNSTWMNLSLLEQTQCTKFLHTTEVSRIAHHLQSGKKDLHALVIPSLHDLFPLSVQHYPYKASYEENCWDPVLILHSSGSTGKMLHRGDHALW